MQPAADLVGEKPEKTTLTHLIRKRACTRVYVKKPRNNRLNDDLQNILSVLVAGY
jgi:hypothetical protein